MYSIFQNLHEDLKHFLVPPSFHGDAQYSLRSYYLLKYALGWKSVWIQKFGVGCTKLENKLRLNKTLKQSWIWVLLLLGFMRIWFFFVQKPIIGYYCPNMRIWKWTTESRVEYYFIKKNCAEALCANFKIKTLNRFSATDYYPWLLEHWWHKINDIFQNYVPR